MQLRVFTIPVFGGEFVNEEMNKFMRANRIISVDKQYSSTPQDGGFWTFCVSYIENSSPQSAQQSGKQKVDYREVLDEKTFAKFSRLREIRKQIAESEAVAAYVVFTDAELAEISKLDEISTQNMLAIKGIGKAKVEKYGDTLCNLVKES